MKYPWEAETLPAVPLQDTVRALQSDMRYALANTAIMVRSDHEALQMLVNTRRGQIVPRNECYFTDGTKFELQDIGMPQVGAPEMSVQELITKLWEIIAEMGLELRK